MRNVKNSAFFFIKSIVYLKSYINFEEIIKVKVMKTRNTKIRNIEEYNGVGYFDIECGRFGTMLFEFYIEFNVDSDYELESVDVKISSYDWESENENLKSGKLNKRNTKFICEYIESIILDDPRSYGFDENDFIRKDEEDFDYYQELTFEERRLSNI